MPMQPKMVSVIMARIDRIVIALERIADATEKIAASQEKPKLSDYAKKEEPLDSDKVGAHSILTGPPRWMDRSVRAEIFGAWARLLNHAGYGSPKDISAQQAGVLRCTKTGLHDVETVEEESGRAWPGIRFVRNLRDRHIRGRKKRSGEDPSTGPYP